MRQSCACFALLLSSSVADHPPNAKEVLRLFELHNRVTAQNRVLTQQKNALIEGQALAGERHLVAVSGHGALMKEEAGSTSSHALTAGETFDSPSNEASVAGGKAQMRREMPITAEAGSVPSRSEDTLEAFSLASSSFGHKLAVENLTNHPPTLSAEEAKDRLKQDGIVDVYNAADDQSKQIKLEEETIECMMDTPVWECMEKHGSYGVRRLYTGDVEDLEKLSYYRKDWMGHTEVQNKKLFEVTWPGTHDSGAYGFDSAVLDTPAGGKATVKGAITQSLDTYTQLSIGVRALDVQVAVAREDGKLYSANGFLMTTLMNILTDVASFLETHHKEMIFLSMRKADVWNGIELEDIQPLKDEETDPNKIPGESVHKSVQAILGKHLATYEALKTLPAGESAENPRISKAAEAGIRVFYFWEGQQVLCIDKASCETTPGWERGTLGEPLAFGPGMVYGARTNLHKGTAQETYIEPGCIHTSLGSTVSSNPFQLLMNIKKHANSLMEAAKKTPPKCFPQGADAPALHTPALLYEADVWPSPFSQSEGAYRTVYQDVSEIYTRGESATLKSEAERVNYLTLNWLLRKNWQPLFTKLNVISMDYVAPINVQRIIEANQNQQDCGYAIHCKETGSCWAQTLLDEESNSCKDEENVLAFLKWHADGEPWPWWVWVLFAALLGFPIKVCVTSTCCYSFGYRFFPTCCMSDGCGIVWWKRPKKANEPQEPLLEEPVQETMESETTEAVAEVNEETNTADF
jgi:hypothetical protein